ncbi:MAG: SCO family protein [Deltaproteobacteria bacterium]|nr:SCO family protein [Deltaproteobacteria bacterium]
MEPDGFDRVEGFVGSWRFAVSMIALLAFFAAWVGAILLIPEGESSLAAFASDFRVWCFGYDAEKKSLNTAMVMTTFSELLVLAVMIALVWLAPLRAQLARGVRPMLPYVSASFVLAGTIALGFGALATKGQKQQLELPAAALRTSLDPPSFSLRDQNGDTVSLQQLRGRIVLLTAVYASCGYSCPTVMMQTKRVVASLSEAEREQLTVLAITLDPEHDDQRALKELEGAQKLSAPLYRLLTGEPADVNAALDAMQVARERNPKTGVIDHANVFLLIDKGGRLAYRFALGALQERWLTKAIELLAEEPQPLTASR